ncbi:DUF4126 domain-containing protein [uncultured Desulfuromusa sp.]|uniref:DUF4126 domain-containing protein n=1 Tax=uncultured Desulfuromusa sp. TaxID=219183 RepID=UPI002AA8C2D2|nr:DUF4126 domain-containing protein [uncultured Desulfuromusa sp.]
MEQLDQIVSIIALSMGVAWASGINLYAVILVLGLLGSTGNMVLPPDLQILMSPLVLFAAGFMYLVEFFADKVPGVDTSWDTLHTFIRIPAGAAMAVGAIGPVDPVVSLAVAIVGGGLAAGTHVTKAGTRVLINASPEPVTNWVASVSEDVLVVAGLWTAFHYPWLFLLLLIVFILLMIWVLPKIIRGVKWLIFSLKKVFTGQSQKQPVLPKVEIPGSFPELPDKNSET